MPTDKEIENAGEQLAQASSSASKKLKWYARAFIVVLIGGIAATLLGGVALGYITPSITLTATVNVGYVIEYLLMFLALVIAVAIGSALLIALPGNYIKGVTKAAAALYDEGK